VTAARRAGPPSRARRCHEAIQAAFDLVQQPLPSSGGRCRFDAGMLHSALRAEDITGGETHARWYRLGDLSGRPRAVPLRLKGRAPSGFPKGVSCRYFLWIQNS